MGERGRRTERQVTEKARERAEAQYKKYGIERMGNFGGKDDRLMTTMAEEETMTGPRFGMGKGPELAEAAHRPRAAHRDRPILPTGASHRVEVAGSGEADHQPQREPDLVYQRDDWARSRGGPGGPGGPGGLGGGPDRDEDDADEGRGGNRPGRSGGHRNS